MLNLAVLLNLRGLLIQMMVGLQAYIRKLIFQFHSLKVYTFGWLERWITKKEKLQKGKIKKIKEIVKVPKNVFALGWVSFFNDLASQMIYPVVPIFLTTFLGVSVSIVGIIEGIAESTASILKVFSGWFSDKFQKRKPFVITGYGISTFSKIIFGLSYIQPFVLLARFIDRFGKGIRISARDSLITESCSENIRGRSF